MTIAEKVWTEKFAEMNHGKTRYWEAGSGTPTILIHGAGWNSGCENWSLAMAPLSQQLRVLAIDCLNWGTGDVLDQEFSFAYLVDHVREFMDVLGIEQANVVGHSMGGWILTLLQLREPRACAAAPSTWLAAARRRGRCRTWSSSRCRAPEQIREHYKRMAEASGGGVLDVDELAAAFIRKRDLPGHPEAFAKVMSHMTNPLTRQRYNTLRRLPHISVPTLVLWGRNDAVNALDETGVPTANGIPNAKLIVYDNTGHGVPVEQADRFASDVLEFLTGVVPGVVD